MRRALDRWGYPPEPREDLPCPYCGMEDPDEHDIDQCAIAHQGRRIDGDMNADRPPRRRKRRRRKKPHAVAARATATTNSTTESSMKTRIGAAIGALLAVAVGEAHGQSWGVQPVDNRMGGPAEIMAYSPQSDHLFEARLGVKCDADGSAPWALPCSRV